MAWFDCQFSPAFDDNGAVAGVLNIAVETTDRVLGERARAEAVAALHESERRLPSVLDGMNEACELMDHDFRFSPRTRQRCACTDVRARRWSGGPTGRATPASKAPNSAIT